jgi:phage terminase large subunit-like protein
LAESLASLPESKQKRILESLTQSEAERLLYTWGFWARPKQLPPPGDWLGWLILAGRGWGKNRTGAEWVINRAQNGPYEPIALISETSADVRDVMVESGDSSILKISPPWFYPHYEPAKRRLTWPNGVVAHTYSGDEPDQLRGPQHGTVFADEPAKWKYGEEAWANMEFGLRIGSDPRWVATTTPRPIALIRRLLASKNVVVTRGSTYENLVNLSLVYRQIIGRFEGTRLGRQELHAEVLEDVPGALWTRATLEACRVTSHPELVRIVTALDPEASSMEDSAETGIICAGLGIDGHGYVLEDATLRGTPHEWGTAGVACYNKHLCDRLIGEVNNGGEMIEFVIRTVDPHVSYKAIHASRGKQTRAEPVGSLFEQGRAHLVGVYSELEDQLCGWTPGDPVSPDRMDAMVWALTELMLGEMTELPEVRGSGVRREAFKGLAPTDRGWQDRRSVV